MMRLILINTQEWLRLKFFHVVLFLAFIYLAISSLLGSLSFVEQHRLILDFGLAGLEVTTFFVSAFLSTHALHRDIERKTIQILLARPIPRWHLLVGYLGSLIALNLIIATVLGGILFFFLEKMTMAPQLVVSVFFILLKSIVLCSFGLLTGALARPMFGLVLTISYWMIAYSIPDLKFFSEKLKNETLIFLSNGLDYLIPQFYRFNWKDFHFITADLQYSQLGWAFLHSISWIAILMILASLFFKRKEIV